MRGQEYFEKNCGIKASKEEMDLWLDSLADFYGFFENNQSTSFIQDTCAMSKSYDQTASIPSLRRK